GITFSYYAEGPFYMINLLGLSPSLFGATFFTFALAGFSGGYLSKKMNEKQGTTDLLQLGIRISLTAATGFATTILLGTLLQVSHNVFVILTMFWVMILNFASGLIIPNALSKGLEKYRDVTGAASSLFGGLYFLIGSLFTIGMGALHNQTLLPMPLY